MTKETLHWGHQGDVFIGEIPKEFEYILEGKGSEMKEDEFGCKTLVRGEHTHHHHIVPNDLKVIEFDDVKVVKVSEAPAELTHYHVTKKELTREHDTIPLKPQKQYFTTGQIEFDVDGNIRAVLD